MRNALHVIIPFMIGWVFLGSVRAESTCPGPLTDTLIQADFESGFPVDWRFPTSNDGANWQVSEDHFGFFGNPGTGKWLFIDDEANNAVGMAFAYLPVIGPFTEERVIDVAAEVNFQAFADSGEISLELWWDGEWQVIFASEEDMLGKLHLSFPWPGEDSLRLRWVYDDGDAWGWGFGMDNFVLSSPQKLCGNNICEPGETPESCPGDCPDLLVAPPANYVWVEPGYDLSGQPVRYQLFKGGTRCDDCSELINLPFSWSLYGVPYEQIWLNSNGNLTFEESYSIFTPSPFCLEGPAMLAPFFADTDLSEIGEIQYFIDPESHYVILNWLGVTWFGSELPYDQLNSFQVIMTDGSVRQIGTNLLPYNTNLIYSYGEMSWTTGNSSGGVDGWGGVPATVGVNLGDGNVCQDLGTFGFPDWRYFGNVQDDGCEANGVRYLSGRSFFWQGETGGTLSPVGVFSFSAAQEAAHVQLTWETDCPMQYRIFRGPDSLNIEEIATLVPEDGQAGQFTWADTAPMQGPNVYVLQAYDDDVEQRHTTEVNVGTLPLDSGAEGAIKQLAIGPNPIQEQLRIRFQAPQGAKVSYLLVDMAGRQHRKGQLDVPTGMGEFVLQTSDLPAAMYVMTLFHEGRPYHKNLVKVK